MQTEAGDPSHDSQENKAIRRLQVASRSEDGSDLADGHAAAEQGHRSGGAHRLGVHAGPVSTLLRRNAAAISTGRTRG